MMEIHNPNGLPTIDYRLVKPLQGNLKELTKVNHDKLLRVLLRRGFTTPLFLWQNGEVFYLLDGHQRQTVMIGNQLNHDGNFAVPYVLINAKDEADAKAQLLEITSQYGHITDKGFTDFALDIDNTLLADINFDAIEVESLLDRRTDEDEPPTPAVDTAESAISRPGETYSLGEHKLMCGDSTAPANVLALLGGVKPDMVFTDPPYNAAFNGRSGNHEVIMNDKMPDSDFQVFIAAVMSTIYTVAANAPKYVCTDWKMYPLIYDLMARPAACIVWYKNVFGMGGGYRHQHELIVFEGTIEANDQSDVWEVAKDSGAEYDHPTQKPVALAQRAIRNSSKRGGSVLDLFGGSGSTLLAAERLGRACYMMEMDPKYCDVIRKRYAEYVAAPDWQAATPAIATPAPLQS